MMSDNELLTVIDISTHDNSSQALQSITQAGAQTVATIGQLGAAMGGLQQQVNSTAAALEKVRGQLQQNAQAAQSAASQLQAANRSIQQTGAGGSGGFTQQMQQGLQQLTTHAQNLGRTFQGLTPQLHAPFQALGSVISGAQGAVQGFGNTLTSALGPLLQGAGFALAIAGVNGLAGAFQALAGTAIGFNSTVQLATISFASFTHSTEAAKEEVKALQVLAATSPFEFQDVLIGARRFQTLGLTAGQTITLLKDLSAIGGSFGLDTNQFGRAELAIQQVGVKGKLTGEELRQMGNDGFNALKIIQEVTGQSMSSIQKDIEAGTFTAQKFFAILHQYAQSPDIQDLAKNIQGSFAVVSSNVHDLLQQLTSTATKPLFESLTAGLSGLQTALMSTGVQQFAADLGATFQDLLSKLQPLEPAFHRAFDMLQSGDIAGAASTAFGAIGDAVNILTSQMFGAGENIIGQLAGGILSGAGQALQSAAEFAAGIVASFLVGNSPPPTGPLKNVDQGGRATADAWIQGFQTADFTSAGDGAAVAVRDALGKVSGGLSPESGRQALQGAGQDMDKLREVAEAAAGATRTLGDELRTNQTESRSLARESEALKASYDDQIEPLERQLQSLRDQGDEQSKLYDLEKRRRDLTLSAQERLAQGDMVKRAELQNQDDSLAQQEKLLRLQEQKIRLDNAGKTGKDAEGGKAQEAALDRQINELAFRRASIQAQMDGLVDREALARVKVAKAQADQADAQQSLQKAQEDYTKGVEEDRLTKEIHTLKNQQEDANKPLEERKKLLDLQRESLQEQSQEFARLKADAGELTSQLKAQEAERKKAEADRKKDAKAAGEAGRDAPIGLGLPEADVKALAAQAGNQIGQSMLGGIQAKIASIGPALIGGAIGAAVGGAALGPIGAVAGAVFGADFATSLVAKVPNLGTILSDSLTTFKQALAGDWKPPGVDEWVNPFVENVGKAGVAIKEFGTSFSTEWTKIDGGGQVSKTLGSLGTLFNDLGSALLYSGTSAQTAGPQLTAAGSAGKSLADGFKDAAVFVKQVSDAIDVLAKTIKPVVDALNYLNQLNQQQARAARERGNPGAAGLQAIGDVLSGQPIQTNQAKKADLQRQAIADYTPYVEGVALALEPLGPTFQEAVENAGVFLGPTLQEAVDNGATVMEGLPTAIASQALPVSVASQQVGDALVTPISTATTATVANTNDLLPGVTRAVAAIAGPTATASTTVGTNIQQPIGTAVQSTLADANGQLPNLAAIVAGQAAPMTTAATEVGLQLQTPVATAVTATIEDTTTRAPALAQLVTDQQKPMQVASTELGVQLQTPVAASVTTTLDDATTRLPGIPAAVTAQHASMYAESKTLGERLTTGFLESIKSGENPVLQAVGGLVERVKSLFAGAGSGEVITGAGPDAARAAARKYNIDQEQFVRQIQQEHGFQTDLNPNGSGARGIAQFIPSTADQAARMLGVTTEEFWGSVNLQLEGAAKLMAYYTAKYGNDTDALVAYNAGESRVGGSLPQETIDYVRIIKGAMPRGGPVGAPSSTGGFLPINLTATQATGVLDPTSAQARCGPYAAQLFVQAIGRNPTAKEADELATHFGWRPGLGMTSAAAWPDMAQELINRTGGGAQVQQIDKSQAGAVAQTGAPVVFNTPAHYFAAQGYNKDTGQFHVGATGTFAGGKEWMTADEIEAVGGRITAVFTEIKTGSAQLGVSQQTLGEKSRLAAQQMGAIPVAGTQAAATLTKTVTVIDSLYDSVANGTTPLETLQAQLVEIGAKAGVSGAAGDLQQLVDGTESGAQALENMAVAMSRTNPGLAALVKNYQAAGGAARASLKDTEKFALDVLNVMHAAQGQDISAGAGHENLSGIKAGQGEKNAPNSKPGGSSSGGGISASSPVAQPLAAINTQIQTGSDLLPTLTKGWTDATAAVNLYLAVDLTPALEAIQAQVTAASDDLVNAWHTATQAVEDYIAKAKEAASLDVQGSHLEGAREIKRTGIYQLHEGEEVRSKAQVRQESYQSNGSTDYVSSRAAYIDQKTINFNAVDPRQMLGSYERVSKRLERLRVRGR